MKIQHINAIVLGYVLSLLAVYLNLDKGADLCDYGVLAAVLSLACGYFHEVAYVNGTKFPAVVMKLPLLSVVLTVVSFILWFWG